MGSGVGSDETTVLAAASQIVTAVDDATITLGQAFTDTATVTGPAGAPTPTGTVDFFVYGPDDPTCAGPPFGTSTNRPLAAGGTATSGPFTPTAPGTYRVIAVYSGDANYTPASGACNDPNESVLVSQATAEITTSATAVVTLGSPISDTATVTAPAGAPAPTAPSYSPCSTPATRPVPRLRSSPTPADPSPAARRRPRRRPLCSRLPLRVPTVGSPPTQLRSGDRRGDSHAAVGDGDRLTGDANVRLRAHRCVDAYVGRATPDADYHDSRERDGNAREALLHVSPSRPRSLNPSAAELSDQAETVLVLRSVRLVASARAWPAASSGRVAPGRRVGGPESDGEVDAVADDVMGSQPRVPKLTAAERMLQELLADGSRLRSEVAAAACERGHGWRTVETTKAKMGVTDHEEPVLGRRGPGPSYWKLPAASEIGMTADGRATHSNGPQW